jgi:hypothetical protein
LLVLQAAAMALLLSVQLLLLLLVAEVAHFADEEHLLSIVVP